MLPDVEIPSPSLFLHLGHETPVQLADGTFCFDEVDALVPLGPEGPYVSLFMSIESGRLVVNSVTISRSGVAGHPGAGIVWAGPEITASAIHALPLESIVERVVHDCAQWAARTVGRADADAAASAAMHQRRRHAITDDLLRQVSEIARSHPDAPTIAVSAALPTSRRNASRLIAEARRRGFFDEPTEQGGAQ